MAIKKTEIEFQEKRWSGFLNEKVFLACSLGERTGVLRVLY
jgi:hypothetical protein